MDGDNWEVLRLVGLKRVSPCCRERVSHLGFLHDNDTLEMYCVDCGEVVEEFLLENCLGEVVWPPPDEVVAQVGAIKRAPRNRRKPEDPEPECFRLHLPGER